MIATGIVALHIAATPDAGRAASSGMTAFGDLLVFILVFGPLALAPTAMLVYFLWPRRRR